MNSIQKAMLINTIHIIHIYQDVMFVMFVKIPLLLRWSDFHWTSFLTTVCSPCLPAIFGLINEIIMLHANTELSLWALNLQFCVCVCAGFVICTSCMLQHSRMTFELHIYYPCLQNTQLEQITNASQMHEPCSATPGHVLVKPMRWKCWHRSELSCVHQIIVFPKQFYSFATRNVWSLWTGWVQDLTMKCWSVWNSGRFLLCGCFYGYYVFFPLFKTCRFEMRVNWRLNWCNCECEWISSNLGGLQRVVSVLSNVKAVENEGMDRFI